MTPIDTLVPAIPADVPAAPETSATFPGTGISVFDLFSIGIGPSSSHTVGPMRAAARFAESLVGHGILADVARVRTELFGSLGATGRGHGTPKAVLLGLEGTAPESIDPSWADIRYEDIQTSGQLNLNGERLIGLTESTDVVLHRRRRLPLHTNGIRFTAYDGSGAELTSSEYYSIGGGFIVDGAGTDGDSGESAAVPERVEDQLPLPFASSRDLLARTSATGLPISGVMMTNELARRTEDDVRARLLAIWQVMRDCVARGRTVTGTLPGGLRVPRRAAALADQLASRPSADDDPLRAMDWVSLYALAVNEENAAGGRVVTAPTNGAAGIVPAVLHYYVNFVPGADEEGVIRFLLTAGAIGALCKHNASISGAEVGCQGEVGSACAMAAAGLTEVLGGTPEQVENAAEIAMEHNLGLTCDPIGGLVQIPCIERNAIASIKAITAARIALRGDGSHHVSLDQVILTMLATGRDMKDKYKETSRGGLALNITEC